MSRIGKKPIVLPAGVEAVIQDGLVEIKGPKGKVLVPLHPHIKVEKKDSTLVVTVIDEDDTFDRSLWGLFGSLLKNAVEGVVKEFEKRLELVGVGFKAAVKGQELVLEVGFSHPVNFKIPEGVTITVDKEGIVVKGVNKGFVGEVAARIRAIKKPEPYKGTGIKYKDEVIKRKAGKTAAKAAA